MILVSLLVLKSSCVMVLMLFLSWVMLFVLIRVEVMCESRSVQVRVIWVSVWLWFVVILFSVCIFVIVCLVSRLGESELFWLVCEFFGMLFRYWLVSIFWVSGEKVM